MTLRIEGTGFKDGGFIVPSAIIDCNGCVGVTGVGGILCSQGNYIEWVAPPPAGIPCSLLTAKGDIVAATASATPTALPVGTNGQVLTSCSTCTSGLTWATPSGVPSWTSAGTVTSKVTGVTSNPSAGNVGFNTVYYRQLGAKEYEVVYKFNQSAPGSAGSGDYLFTLPAGLQFDTTLQFQAAVTFGGPNSSFWLYALPGPTLSHITDGTNTMMVAQPMIYDATRFRLVGPTGGTFSATTINAMGSSVFPFSTFGLGFITRFQFTAA